MTTFLRRVQLKNYKNIEACDVELGPLTFLVGPNGSGKSNFLDALGLLGDTMRTNLRTAIHQRGGMNDIRRRATERPHRVGLRLDADLEDGMTARYAFEIEGYGRGGAFRVIREKCTIWQHGEEVHWFDVSRAGVGFRRMSLDHVANLSDEYLYLIHLAGLPGFRELHSALARIMIYDIEPNLMREITPPDPGTILMSSGRNAAGVLARIEAEAPTSARLVMQFLQAIVPDIAGVEQVSIHDREALQFRQGPGQSRFYASSMSDGTLRALGVLLALFQSPPGGDGHVLPLIGIEEPESALHPAALAVLLEALGTASDRTQVVVTSHSTVLLDREDIPADQILAVSAEDGRAIVGRLDETQREVLRDKLATPGELLAQGQLEPDGAARTLAGSEFDLFASMEAEG